MKRGYLRLDIADNCNIRCVMCQAYNSLPIAKTKFFDFNTFREMTKGQLGNWSAIQLGNIAEATIHPKFADFLRYVRSESDALIHIVTNGKLLHRYASLINEVGNCMVQVSMDSVNKQTHEYIREGSNFDRAVANLEMLDVKRTKVLLSFTLMNSNIGEYDDMVEFCRVRGFQMSAFPMILRDEAAVIPYRLLKESLWFNKAGLENWMRRHYGADYDSIVRSAAPGTIKSTTAFSCNAHQDDLAIYDGGTTVLCGKVSLGKLGADALESMWQSQDALDFRAEVDKDRGPCMTCDYRQRCLSPSMSLLSNHFNEGIISVLTEETRKAISFNRTIRDDEAVDLFVRDVAQHFAVYDVTKAGNRITARRVHSTVERGEQLEAASADELQNLMSASVHAPTHMQLVEEGYKLHNIVYFMNMYWVVPQPFGPVNLRIERDRPGIRRADTLEEARAIIDEFDHVESVPEPESVPVYPMSLLLQGYQGHNIIEFKREFWALPQSLGPVDLNRPEDRSKVGVIRAETLEHLRQMVPQ